MYSIYDYVRSGLVFANNMMRRRRKKIDVIDDLFHNKLSVTMQALLHLEKARGTSFFRKYKENDE